MNIKGCLMHNSDDWKTPSKIYKFFIDLGCIDTFKYQANYNELDRDYFNERLFVNPPFSKMKEVAKWIEKQYENGCTIYLLIPARTDTEYFHNLLKLSPTIHFIKGRLHYNDDKNPAPFPTILMIFGENTTRNYWSLNQCELGN